MPGENPYDLNYEPMRIEQRIRTQNLPVGLRNIGNTCYFNSLLQVYYSMPHFVTKILSFPENLQKEDLKGKDDKKTNQIHSGLLLITELKKVFGRMAIGNKKYVEPGGVLKAIVDENLKPIQIGEEYDIT